MIMKHPMIVIIYVCKNAPLTSILLQHCRLPELNGRAKIHTHIYKLYNVRRHTQVNICSASACICNTYTTHIYYNMCEFKIKLRFCEIAHYLQKHFNDALNFLIQFSIKHIECECVCVPVKYIDSYTSCTVQTQCKKKRCGNECV